MSNIDKQALRERYSLQPVPKCHICDTVMTIARASAGAVMYACSGCTYDDNGAHYVPGRSLGDDHYSASRVTIFESGDHEVLALLDELEAAEKRIAEHNFENRLLANADRDIKALRQRIAELSASHSKLRDTMATIYNTIRMDGGYTPLAAILNAAKRAYDESASAAGIGVKGE
ncbi:ead/Ea22-like family protein [Citrobacter freundii]|uniref:ead/Ea22-like family protein n=1 Tax=Citrobacter freundii TaxID=546 RepID=UPI003B2643E4